MKELETIRVLFFRPLTLAACHFRLCNRTTWHRISQHVSPLQGRRALSLVRTMSFPSFLSKARVLGGGVLKMEGRRVGVELVWLSRQQPSLAQGRSHPASRVSSHESLAQVCCEVLEAHCRSSAQWASLCVPPPSCCLHRCMRFCPYSFKHFVYPLCLT